MNPQVVVITLYADESADIKKHESMGDALEALGDRKQQCSALIHTGDIWSEIGAFFKILHNHFGSTLVTEDAMQQENAITDPEKVTTYYESQTHRPVGVFSFQLPKQIINLHLQDHETVEDVMDDSLDFKATPAKEISPSSVEEQIEANDNTDPFMLLEQAPDWLLDLNVSQLVQFPTRLGDKFQANGINTVADLRRFNAESMLQWSGVGKRSLTVLSDALCMTEQVHIRSNDEHYRFCDALKDALDSLDKRERNVFEKRFGLGCESSMTLEQVGKLEGVTRERIRQIEVKAVNKIKPYPLWSLNLVSIHLEDLLQNREKPLFLNKLAEENAWFSGFSGSLECMADLIELITEQSFSVFDIRSQAVVCRIHEVEWEQQINQILSWVKEKETTGLTKADILSFTQSCLEKKEAGELAEELYAVIANQLHFSTLESESNEAVLVSVGHGYTPLVLSVLREIPVPMHFREITKLCVQKDASIDERRVQSILVEHACLFAMGTYGLKAHLPIDVAAIEQLKADLIAIIFSGDPERQWNCQGLMEQLRNNYPNTPAMVDKYIVDIVLDEVPQLKSLGLLIWVRRDSDGSPAQRIDLQEMATDILMRSDSPMTLDEIKVEISKVRGVGEHFLLKTTSKIARVSTAIWGIVERDFYLSRNEIDRLLNALHLALSHEEGKIHMQESHSVLRNIGYTLPGIVTDYMIMSLAQTDTRFHITRRKIIALAGCVDEFTEVANDIKTGISEEINFSDCTVVLTGTFKSMRRKEAKSRLEALGARVGDKISASTDYLIAGGDVLFNSKYKTAKKSGISIVDEESMLNFFRESYRTTE